MRKLSILWLLPICSAIWAGACVDPMWNKLSQTERDIRWAIAALALSTAALILYTKYKDTFKKL